MRHERDISWLKNRRVILLGVCCLIAGFLVAALIFGGPWHLLLAWGDIPTWLLVVTASVAGWAALGQLRSQQDQITKEAARGAERDELLLRQLETFRRQQAEQVEVSQPVFEQGAKVYVYNGSTRPITGITCKIMSYFDQSKIASPIECEPESEPEKRLRGWMLEYILPKKRGVFIFSDSLREGPYQLVVAWFSDDARSRWQLDHHLHLVPAGDKDKYLP